jgi:hypothetical protein
MKTSRRGKTDNAVVGVVTAVLLTGVIVGVISLVQTVYVPKIMEQREAEHMEKVAEQFAHLTSIIDGQAADQTKGIPVATSITLGSKELPYLLSVRAFGLLEISKNACTVSISNGTLAEGVHTSVFSLGTITYSSANAYFLDQTYTYESGAMIVSQERGNLMMVRPNFSVDSDIVNQTVTVFFDVVNISGVGQKTMAAGYGTYPIQTEFHAVSVQQNFTHVHNMTIATAYPNAWLMFINSSFVAKGLNAGGYGSDFLVYDQGDRLTIDFSSAASLLKVNVFFKIIEIKAQIGPGWVE